VAEWREEEGLGSYDFQDCAIHAYCAQADVPHVGCVEGMWEENMALWPKRRREGGKGRVGKSRAEQEQWVESNTVSPSKDDAKLVKAAAVDNGATTISLQHCAK
jgi:hypothetical protein